MDTLGTYFQTEREKKGIRLEEIASITKIGISHLKLLEEGQWKKLPPEPFIRGFISAYANYVGLEPEACLKLYEKEVYAKEEAPPTLKTKTVTPALPPDEESPSEVIAHRQPIGWWKISGAIGALVILTGIIFLVRLGSEKDRENIAEIKSETPAGQELVVNAPAPAPEGLTVPHVTENSTPPSALEQNREIASPTPPTESAHEILIEGNERSWVKIIIDDEPPKQFFLKAGGKIKYNAQSKIRLILGNSSGSQVFYNGNKVEGRTLQPGIVSFTYPEGARFPQDRPQAPTPVEPEVPTPEED